MDNIRTFAQFTTAPECFDNLDINITKLTCQDDGFDVHLELVIDGTVNKTLNHCDEEKKDFCSYVIRPQNSNDSVFCEVFLPGLRTRLLKMNGFTNRFLTKNLINCRAKKGSSFTL